ncbi:hypothetical protein DFH06DRAFT_716081 [Mycena polygramma]|nr:hypothetical protein DFH06DRAFT_716081 [Mycena polygramma]
MSEPNADKQQRPIPTSVVDFQRAVNGGLHFRYDMAAVAAAAASTDEIVTQLRNEGVWAARKLARAQAEGQRLQSELGHAQSEVKRLTRALSVVQAQNEHQSLAVRTAHEAQVQAEKQLREAQGVNRSFKIELEVARRSLDRERARTDSTASSVAQLKAERDALWDALAKASSSASTSKVKVEDVDAPMDGVESTVGRVSPEPRPVSFSPALSPPSSPALSISSSSVTSPQIAFRPPPLASPRISSPLASPALVSPPLRSPPAFSPPRVRGSPSQPPPTPPRHRPSPLTSASYVHRPSVTSSVPRPFLTPRSVTQTTPTSSGSGSPHPPTLKRKRSPPAQEVANATADDDDPILPVPDRSPAPPPSRTPSTNHSHSPGPPLPPPPPAPTNTHTHTPTPETDPAPSTPPNPKPKLGLKHLPLLYDTRGSTMYCRSCRRAFPATAAWADLVGHAQGAHADACAGLEALRPAQVVEQSQRLQGLSLGGGGRGRGRGKR